MSSHTSKSKPSAHNTQPQQEQRSINQSSLRVGPKTKIRNKQWANRYQARENKKKRTYHLLT